MLAMECFPTRRCAQATKVRPLNFIFLDRLFFDHVWLHFVGTKGIGWAAPLGMYSVGPASMLSTVSRFTYT
jgi:hypothetical protein